MDGDEHDVFHARRSFWRQNSSLPPEKSYEQAPQEDHELQNLAPIADWDEEPVAGLNISGLSKQVKRVPVGSKGQSFTSKDGSTSTVTAPDSLVLGPSRSSPYQNTTNPNEDRKSFRSERSSYSQLNQQTPQEFSPEVGLLHSHTRIDENCPTHGDILTSPWSWWTTSILALAIYSTVFSGVFLGIAFAKPRWGERIGTNGHLSFGNATLLSALLSKTVELSFVTIFVALLGQILSRRAFAKTDRNSGISIAEMTMRSWVMQPGTLITNWIVVRYAASTVLGIMVLIAVLAATFYTTAAEALVAPKPKFGPLEDRTLWGQVSASYANSIWLAQSCETPVQEDPDPEGVGPHPEGDTCLQIDYAGQSFHNFKSFMSDWRERLKVGNTSSDPSSFAGRSEPVATLFDNTTVQGQWITPSRENITADSDRWGRLVQNVTLAMPHANLFNAARDPRNHILQPEDLQGNGEYFIQAAIPAPLINVLCVGMSTTELAPMIVNVSNIADPSTYFPRPTAVDDIFNFGTTGPYDGVQQAPVFSKLPIEYNTLGFISSAYGYDAIYLLAAPPPVDKRQYSTNDYVLCSIKSGQYRNCTTYYRVAQSGGQLSVECDKSTGNTLPYVDAVKDAVTGNWQADWKDVGSEWLRSLSLTAGVNDANASSARLLSQMIPAYSDGNPTVLTSDMPTIGEALAVLAGETALLSSSKSPFVHFWNYSVPILDVPQYQNFKAKVSYKDYASGGTQEWQNLFYVILVAVFLLSSFSLVYLLWTFCLLGRVTDYTEPQNMFALAINSPPSNTMSGTCGAGPSGGLLAKKWQVDMQKVGGSPTDRNQHPHFYVRCREDGVPANSSVRRKRRSRPPTIESLTVAESPAIEQYMRLAGKS
ncbi:uncharacterized protein Z519_00692 [Cladophialophora bantiana CBS 173.52]|uniref:Uncharacterized protein n=1 Tax=Cladophialophora bantiana (strain ATCC 10958 / CBS 173.52 / CDC B-1940 / NIH 8579) TaxID=1442370 RepID=A0A0D2IQQ2_CLAB1|nr:uncharacterized protein Z519_00692 [Cladophialophora bantiana CBS 173.52]KIW99029.1 hypothetical protein Z519_00692 [Cladophialophora bantiana CBS 173.52]